MSGRLKPYMIFSQSAGSGECAGLVFAHSHREARAVGWRFGAGEISDEYIDLGANLLRNHAWLMDEADPAKLAAGIPHAIYPNYCAECEHWGTSPIGADGLCESCRYEQQPAPVAPSGDAG